MLTRIIWFLVLLVLCKNEVDTQHLYESVFGTPPPLKTTEPNVATLPMNVLFEIFGQPNSTEVPEKATPPMNVLFEIFGQPNSTEFPEKATPTVNVLLEIFGQPTSTVPPEKGSVESEFSGAYKSCKSKTGDKGICVPYYLCNLCTELIITDGNGILDIRVDRECPEALLVCCLEINVQSKIDIMPNEQNSTVDNVDVTDANMETSTPSKKVPAQRRQCGRMNRNGLSVHINVPKGGKNKTSAVFGEFPWMVGVLSDESLAWDAASYLGGGSLIGPRAVLTAAHTVLGRLRDEVGLRVRAGEWETRSTWELFPHVEAIVSEGIIHDNFNPGTLYNDIALLILETPIELVEQHYHIGYACLPPPALIPSGPPSNCYSMGWGSPNEQAIEYAAFLKKIKMPIVPTEPCQKNLRTTHLSSNFLLHHSFICAGGKENEDACFGDGGSPLVCPIAGEKFRSVQVGIVSYGVGCGKGHPGLYTNVANFRVWVDEKMHEKKLDTTTYSY